MFPRIEYKSLTDYYYVMDCIVQESDEGMPLPEAKLIKKAEDVTTWYREMYNGKIPCNVTIDLL